MDNELMFVYVVTWENPEVQDFGVLAAFTDEQAAKRLAETMQANPTPRYYLVTKTHFIP